MRAKEGSDKAGLYLVTEKTNVTTTGGIHSSAQAAKTATLLTRLLTSVRSSVQMGTKPGHQRRLRLGGNGGLSKGPESTGVSLGPGARTTHSLVSPVAVHSRGGPAVREAGGKVLTGTCGEKGSSTGPPAPRGGTRGSQRRAALTRHWRRNDGPEAVLPGTS